MGEIPSNYVSLIDIELVLDDAPGPVEEKIPVDLSPMKYVHVCSKISFISHWFPETSPIRTSLYSGFPSLSCV